MIKAAARDGQLLITSHVPDIRNRYEAIGQQILLGASDAISPKKSPGASTRPPSKSSSPSPGAPTAILCEKACLGLVLHLAISDNSHNVGPGRLNFERLCNIGGEVFLPDCPTIDIKEGMPAASTSAEPSQCERGYLRTAKLNIYFE